MAHRPIVILGADRSGASLVAAMLDAWGAWAGEPSRREVWDYLPLQEQLAALQESAGIWEWSPGFREQIRELAHASAHRESAEQLVAGMASGGTPWFWKDPLLCLYLPFWEQIWADPVYLVTLRDPGEAALSFEKTYLPRKMQGQANLVAYYGFRWQHMMLSVLESAANRPSTLFLSYEDLLRAPVEHSRRLAEHLDRHLGTDRLAGAFLPMIEAIDPGLWRSKAGTPFSGLRVVTAAQKELYRALQQRTRGEEAAAEPFNRSRFPFSAFTEEYMVNVSIFRALFAKEAPPRGVAQERLQRRAATAV